MKMFIEYGVTENCNNLYSFGELCVKCGDCGRKFTSNGILINDDETEEEASERVEKMVDVLVGQEEDK